MQFLILGGTSLTGPHIARELIEQSQQVAVFHRGQTHARLPSNVTHILGDRHNLHEFVGEFKQLAPQVVIDMLAFTREDAQLLMRAFTGLADRVVVASSCDVYRAFGRLHRTEPGPPDPVPLTEDAPLREKLSLHGEEYEKRWVEEVVLSEAKLPGTVLRFPAVHGPGDYRPYEYLKRMEDGRSFILLGQETAAWQFSHGYAENVAHALVRAATNEKVANRIYNVADTTPVRELDWVQLIGKAAGWEGRVIVIPQDELPEHLKENADFNQHMTVDTTRLREELGYQEKVDPFEGMRRTVDWIRAHPPKQIDLTKFDYPAEDSTLERLAKT